jgi:hypothetical protein
MTSSTSKRSCKLFDWLKLFVSGQGSPASQNEIPEVGTAAVDVDEQNTHHVGAATTHVADQHSHPHVRKARIGVAHLTEQPGNTDLQPCLSRPYNEILPPELRLRILEELLVIKRNKGESE